MLIHESLIRIRLCCKTSCLVVHPIHVMRQLCGQGSEKQCLHEVNKYHVQLMSSSTLRATSSLEGCLKNLISFTLPSVLKVYMKMPAAAISAVTLTHSSIVLVSCCALRCADSRGVCSMQHSCVTGLAWSRAALDNTRQEMHVKAKT